MADADDDLLDAFFDDVDNAANAAKKGDKNEADTSVTKQPSKDDKAEEERPVKRIKVSVASSETIQKPC